VIQEFGPEALIVSCTDDERAERSFTLSALLPDAFGPGSVAGSR
jgi:cytidine deaminase